MAVFKNQGFFFTSFKNEKVSTFKHKLTSEVMQPCILWNIMFYLLLIIVYNYPCLFHMWQFIHSQLNSKQFGVPKNVISLFPLDKHVGYGRAVWMQGFWLGRAEGMIEIAVTLQILELFIWMQPNSSRMIEKQFLKVPIEQRSHRPGQGSPSELTI